MAEVASKKSMNVVSSSKKSSEACSVKSNNGLIDLDNITSSSNNQLITKLSDDDLLIANNTSCNKNDINVDDKSLQELIESELALRISSTNDIDNGDDEGEYDVIAGFIEEIEVTRSQPEITKIVLEPRPNPQDINSEFIIAEINHYNVIEDRYPPENGHFLTDLESTLQNEHEPVTGSNGISDENVIRSQRNGEMEQNTILEDNGRSNIGETVRDISEKDIITNREGGVSQGGQVAKIFDDQPCLDNVDGDYSCRSVSTMDHSAQVRDEREQKLSGKIALDDEQSETKDQISEQIFDSSSSKTNELLDTWSNPESSGDTLLIGQFSDNFDESLTTQQTEVSQVETEDSQCLDVLQNLKSEETRPLETTSNQFLNEDTSDIVQGTFEQVFTVTVDSTNGLDSQTFELTDDLSSEQQTLKEQVVQGENVESLDNAEKSGKVEAESLREVTSTSTDPDVQDFEASAGFERTVSSEVLKTQEFIEFERLDAREAEISEKTVSPDDFQQSLDLETSNDSTNPKETSSTVEVIQATEKSSNSESPRVFSDSIYADHCFVETHGQGQQEFESWTTVEQATGVPLLDEPEGTEDLSQNEQQTNDPNLALTNISDNLNAADLQQLAPLATPDDEISDVSNKCDSHIESREEVITTTSVVTNSTTSAKSTKTAKTKKKKIEGVANSDASPGLTPRTKKTKKSKKSESEKENVNGNIDESNMRTKISPSYPGKVEPVTGDDELSNVNVKTLCRSWLGDLSNMSDTEADGFGQEDHEMPDCEEKSSFNKFDALSKKPVLHVRSVDTGKVQQQFNSVGQNGEPIPNCRSCGKVVFQMEQTKAEGLIWHKNCFRCNQCSKQLNVDNYQSHETTLYCKAHFKELFQPKPVEESDQPIRPRKPELIIRENQPKELPPDVVRASDKPDLGLEELSALNVKSRFQVFEKTGVENNDIERSPSQVAVKRSPSILSKLAKFQAKGMDIGVADESLNGIPYEESSESEEEEEDTEEVETEIIKAKRSTRERPMSFSKMDDMKNRWESTSQQGRRESQREARKEEIAGIRSRLFMGKQGKMKEMYQQAVAESERVTKINAAEEIQEIQQTAHARSIKERFERGEPIAANDDENPEDKFKHQDRPDEEVIAAGISKKSRSLFLELDATAAKTARPVTPVTPKTPADSTRRARDAFVGRQVSEDVIRSTDTAEEVRAETSDISNKFKFFEAYKAPEKQRRQFRITPPRDGQVKMESPEREIYRDPEVVRADDRVDEVVRTDTTTKMLSIFRQMEEKACKEDLPDGPKPLKRFTPPPEDKFAKPTASESEEEDDEEGEESEAGESGEERDPNYVRASDKVEDEFLKQAQNAARAKTLRAKFEHWKTTDDKVTNHNVAEMEIAQGVGDQSSIESASSLRARFESLGSQPSEAPRTAKVKVNRFVELQTTSAEVCESCQKKVYPLEKVETNNKIFHKQCFRCLQCNCILRMDTFTLNNGKLYCIPHFKQLFITRGNYDEGFGINPHKNKWASSNAGSPAMPITSNTPTPIAVSNGDL
ncbi:xin actin-binding repeat-containing protein 2 isoform X11 [Athalia rosae]|uniref:xin actin-binding repeat-containing protein 2 isoform X11 n=1 Tax=Athalia rosae TaxID=37344 RepID=UPI002033ABCF|nr:xin actin-binding repeat-containing protein 2 isoform X11 [Athalia rosae]